MSKDLDGHRFANINEPSCKSCASFDSRNDKCDSIDTTIHFTYSHQRCRYYINKHKFLNSIKYERKI